MKDLSLKIIINTMQIIPDSGAPRIIGNLIVSINSHQLHFTPKQYSVSKVNKGVRGHEDAKFLELNMSIKDWVSARQ